MATHLPKYLPLSLKLQLSASSSQLLRLLIRAELIQNTGASHQAPPNGLLLLHELVFAWFTLPGKGKFSLRIVPGLQYCFCSQYKEVFPGGAVVKNPPAMQETRVQSLSWEDPLWRRKWLSLQYFCLDSPMDRGAWQATVRRVTKSQMQLSTHTLSKRK